MVVPAVWVLAPDKVTVPRLPLEPIVNKLPPEITPAIVNGLDTELLAITPPPESI